MTPIVHLGVERQWLGAARMLGDDNLGAAFVGVGDDGAAVEGLVADRTAESDAVNERRHADGIGAPADATRPYRRQIALRSQPASPVPSRLAKKDRFSEQNTSKTLKNRRLWTGTS